MQGKPKGGECMIASKRIAAVTMAVVVISLFICGGIVYAANVLDTTNIPEYQEKLFGGDILAIDILACLHSAAATEI